MKITDNTRGAFLMMGSMAAFTLNDASIKSVAGDMHLFQAVFLRGILTTILIGLLAGLRGHMTFVHSRRDWRIITMRTLAEIGATVAFLSALFHMPIADVTAILQVLPLAITFAGALFLGEKVGWRRYGAIALGFAGVLLIVRPGGDGFSSYALLALLAVGFVVVRDLATRRLSPQVPSLSVAFITALAITILSGSATMLIDWQAVTAQSAGFLVAASVFIIGGYVLSIMVMRVGEIAFVAPFRYSALVWAIVLGVVVFGDIPDFWTVFGSVVVVGTGLFSFYRERVLAK